MASYPMCVCMYHKELFYQSVSIFLPVCSKRSLVLLRCIWTLSSTLSSSPRSKEIRSSRASALDRDPNIVMKHHAGSFKQGIESFTVGRRGKCARLFKERLGSGSHLINLEEQLIKTESGELEYTCFGNINGSFSQLHFLKLPVQIHSGRLAVPGELCC